MFTGLIEEQGKIKSVNVSSMGMELTVECEKILDDVVLGASISVNGACQTVTDFGKNYITVQASNETLKVTNFKNLKQGDLVNLERALTLNKRIDGHIVSGHVDCCAKVMTIINDGFSKNLLCDFTILSTTASRYRTYRHHFQALQNRILCSAVRTSGFRYNTSSRYPE